MQKSRRLFFRQLWLYLPLGCFVVAVLGLCFSYGVAVGRWQVFPFKFIDTGWNSLRELRNKPKYPHWINPARYEGKGVVTCEHAQVHPGVTLLAGPWRDGGDWNLGIRLIDLDGKVLHQWQCNPQDIWEESPHDDYGHESKDDKTKTNIHGALLLPDGDVIFNLEFFSLVRMNSDSEVVWKLPYRTHHSVFQDSEGDFWVCGTKSHERKSPKYVGLKPPFFEDMIVKVSPKGVIEREISLLEVIYRSGYVGLLRKHTDDILHLNDIEVLDKDKADAFSDIFEAGDIMISMRHANAICVIDGRTEQIKWSLTHPFFGQHDPDFTEDGHITVFDNHSDWRYGVYRNEEKGSRIIQIEPSTGKVTTIYGWKENQYFFTAVGGKQQHLANGNILITEVDAGRVFEISAKGEIVWDWIAERWNKDFVQEIMQGTRYDEELAAFAAKRRR